MSAALEALGLVRRYGNRVALREVSVTLASGELVALLGANGAGKTTLLSILAGVAPPDCGTVRSVGRVGWVPQGTAVYGKLTVVENLRLFATLERVGDPAAAVEAMLDQTGLRDRADDQVATLSGGNRQRVNVAIGLLAAPSVLLLDEPSAALDPRQRERLWAFVGELARRGTSVLYSTHEVADAARHASRVLVLADGELVFAGSPEELGSPEDLEAALLALLAERGG